MGKWNLQNRWRTHFEDSYITQMEQRKKAARGTVEDERWKEITKL